MSMTASIDEALAGGGDASDPIQDAFERFLEKNPDVWRMFVEAANRLRSRGFDRYGAKTILEHIRYHKATTGPDAKGFAINNNYTSRFARRLAEQDPTFEGFFSTRKTKAERATHFPKTRES